jgi:hypothetical protein
MADLTLTGTKVNVCHERDLVNNVLAAVAITGGQVCYVVAATGKANLASAAAASTAQVGGLAIPTKQSGSSGGVGQPVALAQDAEVEGFDLSGLAYWAPIYLSNNAGKLADAAGTVSVVVGRVIPTTELDASGNPRKLLRFRVPFNTVAS